MIRRYRWEGNFTAAELDGQLPVGVNATIQGTNPTYSDIGLLPDPVGAAAQTDLDDFMSSLGWVFVVVDPTTALPTNSAQLLFGCESISGTDTVRYLSPGWDDNVAPTAPYGMPMSRGGTLHNLRVRQNSPGGNTNDVVYTVRIDGAPTALAATMDANVADGFNTADSVQVNAGQVVDIEITKPQGSVGSAPNDVVATVEFAS